MTGNRNGPYLGGLTKLIENASGSGHSGRKRFHLADEYSTIGPRNWDDDELRRRLHSGNVRVVNGTTCLPKGPRRRPWNARRFKDHG